MYGIRYPDGDIDLYHDLRKLKEDLAWVHEMFASGHAVFEGAEPVVQVGTNPGDLQWETFEDARVEIPAWWWVE